MVDIKSNEKPEEQPRATKSNEKLKRQKATKSDKKQQRASELEKPKRARKSQDEQRKAQKVEMETRLKYVRQNDVTILFVLTLAAVRCTLSHRARFTGSLIMIFRSLKITTFTTAFHRVSDIIKNVRTTLWNFRHDALCDAKAEEKIMSGTSARSGSREKIPFDPEHRN